MIDKLNRRHFIGLVSTASAGALLSSCWGKMTRKAKYEDGQNLLPKSTVSIVQSSKSKAEELTYRDINQMVKEAVNKAGGFGDIIHDGDSVVLKPNIMCLWIRSTKEKLRPDVNGVTTDWRVTRAAVEIVRQYNPSGKVYVMESSAFQMTQLAMEELKYTHEYIPNVDEFICIENSGEYQEWDSPKLEKVELPKGYGLYPDYMKPNKSKEFYMNKIYYNADVVISMPVLKNHTHTGITGAIKNVGIGASPPNIYGKSSPEAVTGATQKIASKHGVSFGLNRSLTINHARNYLDLWIHDYYLCRPVDFVITDGLNGLQNGPDISGSTRQTSLKDNLMNMRMILAGKDALAVDTVHALVIGMDPNLTLHLPLLSNKSVGIINPANIRIEGNKQVHEVKKLFAMKCHRAAEKMYSHFNPPDLQIKSALRDGNMLKLSLTVNKRKVCKVEVVIDGKCLDQVIVDDFNKITLNVSREKFKNPDISILAYDRFLNCTEKQVRV